MKVQIELSYDELCTFLIYAKPAAEMLEARGKGRKEKTAKAWREAAELLRKITAQVQAQTPDYKP